MKTSLCLVLCTGFLMAALAPAYANEGGPVPTTVANDDEAKVAITTGSREAFHPELSAQKYLRSPSAPSGKPHLVVGYYDNSRGLLAGYQSASGKRLLFRSMWLTNGKVLAEVAHINPANGSVEVLLGITRGGPPASVLSSYQFGGHNLQTYLRENRPGTAFRSADDPGKHFLLDEAGSAFAQAVPALYALLEDFEESEKLAVLQAPYGAILSALQMRSGVYTGFVDPDSVLGTEGANKLREACRGASCKYEGRHFSIDESGLFDPLGKLRGKPTKKSFGVASLAPPAPQVWIKDLLGVPKNCGDCFGMCGPGCFNPGGVSTSECYGHDTCVCMHGHAACINSVPEYCPGCNTLWEAVDSYLGELFEGGPVEYDDPDYEPWWNDSNGG